MINSTHIFDLEIANLDVFELWTEVMDNRSDPRTKDLFMMSSPIPSAIACLSYLFIVKILGPHLMNKRKAFNMNKAQLVFNTFHLAVNAYLFVEIGRLSWFAGYNYRCQPADFSNHGNPLRLVKLFHLYHLSKYTDFVETFIFVLGKRYDLVNFYHWAHHSIMAFCSWIGLKYVPTGHATLGCFVNTFVHVVIYSYLVLTTTCPNTKKHFTWWKSFLPPFQFVQFMLIYFHSAQLLFKNECNYPMAPVYFISVLAVVFVFILVIELKFIKTSKVKNKESRNEEDDKKRIHDDDDESNTDPRWSKNLDVIFNYDSFIRILKARSGKNKTA